MEPKSPATAGVKILHVEDLDSDAELVRRQLKRYGLAVTTIRVWTEHDFLAALRTFAPDVILSDFAMPTFDGLRALQLARERAPEIPFIFVSGSIEPELAQNARTQGAFDFLIKDDLTRLGPTVAKATRRRTDRS